MVTPADVRRWDPVCLENVLRALGACRDRLLDLDDELAAARPVESVWSGAAAEGARGAHEQIVERLRRLAAGVTAARVAIGDAADGVVAVQADIRRAEDMAYAQGFAVAPDGAVTDTRQVTLPVEQIEGYQQQRRADQDAVVRALRAALERAAAVDEALRAALARVTREQVDDGAAVTLVDAALAATDGAGADPPRDGTPQQNADWWRRLAPEQQEHALLTRPDLVGGLNGVPAAVRDEANRARLPDEIARIDAALADATRRRDGAMDEFTAASTQQEVAQLTGQRDALAAVSRTLGQPDRHLLLLDVDGHSQPRAAVAVGDVGTADNVGVLTPGFTSTVAGSLENYTRDVSELRNKTDDLSALEGGRSTATVVWMGYDAPQWSNVGSPINSVGLPFAAQRGGDELAGFYQGVTASRPEHDPHLVALGHSYGSTTTGYALQQAPVDDAVFFGSPGLSTGDVADLQVPTGHASVIEANGDFVADLGSFGPDPNQLDGVTPLESGAMAGPDGVSLRGSEGHSQYLTPGTTSQRSIAATLAGLPEQRAIGDNADGGDVVREIVRYLP